MSEITAQDFFRADELLDGAALSGDELRRAFWQLKKMQREAQQQQTFWKSVNDSLSDAYRKLASFQEELRSSREQLREANERLEQKVRERTAALDEARDLAESVVTSVSDILLVIDTRGIIGRANRAAVDALGEVEADLVGRSIHDIVICDPTCDPPLPPDWLDSLQSGREVKDREASLASRWHEPIPVVFSAALLQSAHQKVPGVVCIAKDVTERRRTEDELRARLAQIEEQAQTIRALFTPIIQLWRRVLVLPIVGALDRARAT